MGDIAWFHTSGFSNSDWCILALASRTSSVIHNITILTEDSTDWTTFRLWGRIYAKNYQPVICSVAFNSVIANKELQQRDYKTANLTKQIKKKFAVLELR